MKFLHKYGTSILFLFRIAIFIAVPFLVAGALSYYTLNSVQYVKYYEDGLYGIDLTERDNYLFRYDLKKETGRVTRVADIKGMTFSDAGRAYLLRRTEEKAEILEWNYKKGSLTTLTEVAFVEGMEPFKIFASNRGIFYIYYIDEQNKEIQCFGYNDEWKPVGSAVLYPCEGFWINGAIAVDSGELFFVSDNGSLYRSVEKAEPELIFDVNDGPEDSTAYTNYYCTPQEVTFTGVETGDTYKISLVGTDYTPGKIKKPYEAPTSFNELMMHNAQFTGNTAKAGSLFISGGKKAAAVCGDAEAVVDHIEWTALQYIVTLLIVAAILALLYLVLRKPIKKLERRMLESDISILISVTVILMVICLAISFFVIIGFLKQCQLQEGKEHGLELTESIVQQLSELDVDELAESGETPLADVYAEYGIAIRFFSVKDGEIFSASAEANPQLSVEMMDPGLSVNLSDSIKKAVQTGSIEQTFGQLYQTKYSVSVVPLGDMFGAPSAMMITLPMDEFWEENLYPAIALVFLNTLIIMGVFVVIIFILLRLEKQLNGLLEASAKVLEGELGAQADDRGFNEVAATIRVFNRMSANLKREEDAVTNCEIVTKAFTPLGLMRQINGGFSDNVVRVGSRVEGKAQVFAVVLEGFNRDLPNEKKEAYHQIIDEFVNALAPLGGSIMDVTPCSIRYVDAEMTNDLFRTVADIIRRVNTTRDIKARAVINVTDIEAAIVGTKEYMILDVFETKPRGTRELLFEGYEKGITLLVTDFAAKIAGLNKYHLRLAGVFHPSSTGKGELLYEALDAAVQSEAMTRCNTKEIFEQGFKDFYIGKTAEARRAMARVLIEDKGDTVARHYLKACEKYSDTKETDI